MTDQRQENKMGTDQQEVGGPGTEVATQDDAQSWVTLGKEVRASGGLAVEDWPDERLTVLYKTVAPAGTSSAEFAMFISVCGLYGLDPFVGEAWLVKDEHKDKIMIMTGRDSFLKIAEGDPGYSGFDAGVVYENDEFALTRKGEDVLVQHIIAGGDRGQLLRGFCVAYRKGRRPSVVVREYQMYSALFGKKNWRNNPDDMLETRCITQALRLLYRISGIYLPDEIADSHFEGGKGMSLGDARQAAGQTAARMEELREKLGNSKFAPTEDAPAEAEVLSEEVATDLLDEPVGFGKFKGKTWGEVFQDVAGPGYIKHYVLTNGCTDPSMTNDMRDLLQAELDAFKAAQKAEAADEPETEPEAQEAETPAPDQAEEPEAQGEPPTSPPTLEEAHERALLLATQLAEAGALDWKDSEEIDLHVHDGNLEGMIALANRFQAQLSTLSTEEPPPDLFQEE